MARPIAASATMMPISSEAPVSAAPRPSPPTPISAGTTRAAAQAAAQAPSPSMATSDLFISLIHLCLRLHKYAYMLK